MAAGSGNTDLTRAKALVTQGADADPVECYLCGGRALYLRFSPRGNASISGAEAYRCTSFGHGSHPPIWKCRRCGMVSQWPMRHETELLDEYRLVEDPIYEAERGSRYHTFRRVLRTLGPAENRTLLDVGAYCGYFLDVAREGGFQPEGLELSKWAAGRARSLGFVVHGETLADRGASGASYDTVTMWDVIEHMADPRAELEEAFRLLRPGGTLCLSTIDIGSLVARAMGRRWPWLMEMHLHYFDRSTITRLLEEVGFVDISVGDYTHYVSWSYLSAKVETFAGRFAPAWRMVAKVVPDGWRVPVNLGDNMLVRSRRPL